MKRKEGFLFVHIYDCYKCFMHFMTNHEVKTYKQYAC